MLPISGAGAIEEGAPATYCIPPASQQRNASRTKWRRWKWQGGVRGARILVVNGVTSDGSKVTTCTVCHTAVTCAASARYQQLRGAKSAFPPLNAGSTTVTFIFTMCTETCPVLTPMMSFVQDRLGADFGAKIAFVSITVDPERDTTDV